MAKITQEIKQKSIATTSHPIQAPLESANRIETKKTPFDENQETYSHKLPLEIESMELSYERKFSRESFASLTHQEQSTLINGLVDSMRDRAFIEKTLLENTDIEIQRRAIKQLSNFNSFASTDLLIKGLKSSSSEIVKTTVESLLKKGDRSLIPYLQAVHHQQSDVELEQYISEAIHTLHYSARMGADGMAKAQ